MKLPRFFYSYVTGGKTSLANPWGIPLPGSL